eukprot:TRINITY_DN10808_c0_g1_i4.p1 TRINITY_DN10808_c0_g1~~TRINITY_DN10808_c0_g1_i4.p1  ORF type:complete len:209 (+),score=20.69 TRINITY_DN10808_c0_g1_i4:72-629(+)
MELSRRLAVASAVLANFASVDGVAVMRLRGRSNDTAFAAPSCSDAVPDLPAYCCLGDKPDPNYADSCDCNPGWSHQECICKQILQARPCHHCMVHLPATNRWQKAFTKDELYENCNGCVMECMEEMKAGTCGNYAEAIFAKHFPSNHPAEVLCTSDYLKEQLEKPNYPLERSRQARNLVPDGPRT